VLAAPLRNTARLFCQPAVRLCEPGGIHDA
jgi:hypothetical protein